MADDKPIAGFTITRKTLASAVDPQEQTQQARAEASEHRETVIRMVAREAMTDMVQAQGDKGRLLNGIMDYLEYHRDEAGDLARCPCLPADSDLTMETVLHADTCAIGGLLDLIRTTERPPYAPITDMHQVILAAQGVVAWAQAFGIVGGDGQFGQLEGAVTQWLADWS